MALTTDQKKFIDNLVLNLRDSGEAYVLGSLWQLERMSEYYLSNIGFEDFIDILKAFKERYELIYNTPIENTIVGRYVIEMLRPNQKLEEKYITVPLLA